MKNNSTAISNVIPFSFEANQVRTALVDGEPWFAFKDIIRALDYSKASAPAKLVDSVPVQWKGVNPIHTPGGYQKLLMLSEQGLYLFLGRSDKPKALPFQMWLAGEVLPAIRKHGSYADTSNKMGTLLGETIGTNGFNMLGSLIKGKVVSLPVINQRRATAKIWSQTHAAFGVRSGADIPANQLDAARNFIAAYALEGEWLAKDEKPEALFTLDFYRAQDVSLLLHYTAWVMHRWHNSIRAGLKELNPDLYNSTWEFFAEAQRAAQRLDKNMPELVAYFRAEGGGNRPVDYARDGLPA